MLELIEFFLAPFLMCLILVGIHCYLGQHVLKRGVIFIDLCLAQVASMGTVFALILGFDHHGPHSYFISLGLTFFAALIFSLARRAKDRISQEVLIGLTYAFSSALSVILLNKIAHGSEHIKEILVGRILWVSSEEVLHTFLLYSGISIVYYFIHPKLWKLSCGEESVFWDFIFFASFGVIITSSVGIAGILLVFSFLIVPSLLAGFVTKVFTKQLFLGWTIGFILSLVGMILSYTLDVPAGAMIVICFTVVPIFSSVVFSLKR